MNHVEAKAVADSLGLTPDDSLALRLVAYHETKYGKAWKGEGAGSNNWGAVTGKGDAGSFRHGDSRNENGEVIQYTTDFARYSTPEAGARGLARVLLKDNVRAAARAHDVPGIARAMYLNRYYTGIHPRSEARVGTPGDDRNVGDYTTALMRGYVVISAAGLWFELPGRTSHFLLTTQVAVRHDVCFLIAL